MSNLDDDKSLRIIPPKDTDKNIENDKKLTQKLQLKNFKKVDDNTYRLVSKKGPKPRNISKEKSNGKVKDNSRLKHEKEFVPGPNYKYILTFSKNDILDFRGIKNRILEMPREKQQWQLTMKSRMVKKLVKHNFLIPLQDSGDTQIYKLSQKAKELLKNKSQNKKSGTSNSNKESGAEVLAKKMRDNKRKTKEVKITKFDIDNIISLSNGGVFLRNTLQSSPKKSSVEKRIKTLLDAGLLQEIESGWELKDDLWDRAKVRENINLEHEKSRGRRHNLDCLTIEQKKTIKDITVFLNLSSSQILKYVYSGNETLFKSDMRYFIRKGILKKDKIKDVFTLTKKGSKLAAELIGDAKIFKSKINSRREELKHDLLIYTAYKDVERELINKGKEITVVKNERQLRSEDMKKNNKMSDGYPDLYIEYEDKRTKEKDFINIEIDVGYSEKVIGQKVKIPKLRWYTNSSKQKDKVLKKARNMYVKIIDELY